MIAAPDSPLATLWCPSPNFEPRPDGKCADLLLLHYTGMASSDTALDWLTRPESRVSAHYLVDEEGRIVQMVAERERAWHAGTSHWAGDDDINSCSIGVEIHNPGHEFGYTEFPEQQMLAVEALCRDIVKRNKIAHGRVLAHSDVAPARKFDPGEKFDWARLARAGVGLWVEPEPRDAHPGLGPGDASEAVRASQARLQKFGYGIADTGIYDRRTEQVVTAFQRHWRPARINGRFDHSTAATLDRLLTALRPA